MMADPDTIRPVTAEEFTAIRPPSDRHQSRLTPRVGAAAQTGIFPVLLGTLKSVVSMKITLSAAMRARDVSRPRPEQLADAAAREEPRGAAGEEARGAQRAAAASSPDAAPAAPGLPQSRSRRRRRRPR